MFEKQIQALAAQIKSLLDEVAQLQTAVEAENRGFTDDESDARKEKIDQIKTLQARKEKLEETEKLMADAKAAPAASADASEVTSAPAATTRSAPATGGRKTMYKESPSLLFANMVHALHAAGGSRFAASHYAKERMNDDLLSKVLATPPEMVERATVAPGTTGTTGWAAELVGVREAAEEFIDLLRPMSIVAGFPGRQLSFGGEGEIKIPRQTAGSTGTWVGENKAIKVDSLTLDEISLTPKKNANIITLTNELVMRSDPSAMMIVRDDILRGIAVSLDTKFVSSDAAVAGVSPAGLQTIDTSSTASTGSTLDQISADLKAAIGAMLALNMPMANPVWLINPLRINSLRFLRDGLGQYAFKDEIASGTLAGFRFIESTTVTDSVVMLVDASQILIASDLAPIIDLSGDASLHMVDSSVADDIGGATTPVQSMFQMDGVAVRAKTTADWASRYANAVQVITSVAW